MANSRIKGITIEIDGNTTKLTKALAQVNREVTKTQSALKDVDKLLKMDPGNTDLLAQKQKYLSDSIEATKNKLKEEQAALDQLKNAPGTDENIRAQETLQREIVETEQNLKNLTKEYKNFGSVGAQQVAAVGDKMKDIGGKMTNVGSTLTRNVTVPIATAFGASVKAAVDWETAFTGVKKTVDATDEEFAQLSENIKQMATETASSKEEIAGVMEIAGQLGITGVDGLTEFTKTMIELKDTTNLSAEEAATSLARFLNITGEDISNVDKIGSAVVDLGNNFATSESEIVEMATRLASTGTIAGMSSTDILALAAAMSSVGIQAEAGGTAMSQTLKSMANAVADFKDGEVDDLEVIAKVAHTSADEFAKAWEDDPVRALQGFIQGLSQVKDEGDNIFASLADMGMNGIRQSNMLQSLAEASDQLSGAITTSSEAYKENTALSEEAQKRYDTMAAKMSQLKERFTEVAISVGEILMPYIEQLMGYIEGLVAKWKELSPEQQDFIVKAAAIVAVAGPLLMIFGQFASAIGSILTVAPKLVGAFHTIAGAFSSITPALSGALSSIGTFFTADLGATLASGGAAAVGTACATIASSIVTFFAGAELGKTIGSYIFPDDADIYEEYAGIEGTFRLLRDTVVTLGEEIARISQETWAGLKEGWALFQEDVQLKFDAFKLGIQTVIDDIKGAFELFWQDLLFKITEVKTAFLTKIEEIKLGVQSAVEFLKNAFNFEWKLPEIKLPHFKINGDFSLKPPSVPQISVDWYANAMNHGTILDSATIFGASNGKLLGAGEAGPEVVVGANSLSSMIRSSMPQTDMVQLSNVISRAVGSALQNYGISIDVTADKDGLFKSIQQSNSQYKKMHGGLGALI